MILQPEFASETSIFKSPAPNWVSNKILDSDWFSAAFIYGLIWLMKHQNCRPIWPVRLEAASSNKSNRIVEKNNKNKASNVTSKWGLKISL